MKSFSVITGCNNSGKSSFLQAVYFLKKAIESKGYLWGTDIGFYLQDFQNTVTNHDLSKPIEISCTFGLMDFEKEELEKYLGDVNNVTYNLTLRNNGLIEETVFVDDNEFLIVNDERRFIIKGSNFKGIGADEKGQTFGGNSPLDWDNAPQSISGGFKGILTLIISILKRNFAGIYYISPDRKIPDWRASVLKTPINVGYHGEDASRLLHYRHSSREEVFEKTEEWMKKFDPELTTLKSPLDSGNTSIVFNTPSGEDINVLMMGFGINTVFPIVMQCLDSPDGSTIIIEEPEIHLHSGSQKIMLDMFQDLTENGKKQIIFTTHSEKILKDIAGRHETGKMKKENVCQHYINKKTDGTRETVKVPITNYTEWLHATDAMHKRP